MARAAKSDFEQDALHPHHPRANTHFMGHEAAEKAVLDAWNAGRFPHAWLIAGPKGIGKASFAYRVARFVLSADGPGDSSGLFGGELAPMTLTLPENSGTVRRITSGGHPDFRTLEITDKTVIPVEAARRAVSFMQMTPAESSWKVIVIDAAEDLNRNAANAILKALEEPPARALFLLVAHRPGRLLPTIRSRCRKLTLLPLGKETVAELLAHYRPELAAEDRRILTELSEGSIGRVISYADAGGVDLYRAMAARLARIQRPLDEETFRFSEKLGARGSEASFDAFRTLLDQWMKNLIRAEAAGTEPERIVAEDAPAMDALRATGNLEVLIELWENLTDLLAQADNPVNLDRRQLVLAAFMKLHAAAS